MALSKELQTLWEKIEYHRRKRQLKQAFRRKPKPAIVRIPDDDSTPSQADADGKAYEGEKNG